MPRNLRNFWVEAEVDGRKSPVKFGPRAKDGGFRMTIYMKVDGASARAVVIEGRALEDGNLLLFVDAWGKPMRFTARTKGGDKGAL